MKVGKWTRGLKRIYETSQVTGMEMINAVGSDELCCVCLFGILTFFLADSLPHLHRFLDFSENTPKTDLF